MSDPAIETTTDALLGGRLTIVQPARGHRMGTDALLLAGVMTLGRGLAVDLGAGVGAVGLAFAVLNPGARVLLVEREPALLDLARDNIVANGLEDRVSAIELDVFAPEATRIAAGLGREVAQVALTNPPFFAAGVKASPEPLKRSAHVMAGGDLSAWVKTAASCLAPAGRIGLIHRAETVADVLAALEPAFGGCALRFVHPHAQAAAIRMIATATKGSRASTRIEPAVMMADRPDGTIANSSMSA